MKKVILALAVSMLAACSTTVPVTAKFPEVPEIIIAPCPNLKKIETETAALSDISKTITHNYTQYYECAVKVDAFAKWYREQRAIFESVK
jgi:hypothetical protein